MRVAFVQKDPLPDPYVATLAAAVAFRGHEARVFLPGAERDLLGAVRAYAPGALVAHAAGGFVDWHVGVLRRLARGLGGPPVCLVGAYATDHPELAALPGVDFVLRGDADETLSELLFRIGREKTLQGTMGTAWVDDAGVLRFGPEREPVTDLDETAAPDYEIYKRYPFVRWQRTLPLVVGRGTMENVHAGFAIGLPELQRRFRPAPRHSIGGAIARVHRAVKRRPFARRVGFRDDTLTLDRDWLLAFLDRMRREVERPFGCMARPDQLPPPVLDALAGAGCDCVRLGIESGDEALRERIAGTALPDALVTDVVAGLRRRGIRVHTVSFLGLPGEDDASAARTPALLARLRPDHAFVFPVVAGARCEETKGYAARLAHLAPLAARVPAAASALADLARRPLDASYERLFQTVHDLAFVRSGELPALDMIHLLARMSRRRARAAAAPLPESGAAG